MGTTKVTNTESVNKTEQATATPEETALNQRNLRMSLATEGPQTQAQLSGLDVINQLLTGRVPGGIYQNMAGIDPNVIANQATKMTLNAMPGMQSLGLLDSGVAAKAISNDVASNLLFPAAQYNVGALQNLMNLALTGQAQVQSPITAGNANLGSQLAGLRSFQTQGTGSSTQRSNPFLQNFFSQAGTNVANNIFSGGW